ncbi:MAG: hypothetical protein R2780_11045 [Crocinitomicaceae bacterium]
MKQIGSTLIFALFCLTHLYGQENDSLNLDQNEDIKEKFQFGGYIKYMNINQFASIDSIYTDNLIHNRLNFKYYATPSWTLSLELRNRLFWGETQKLNPFFGSQIGHDNGEVDLSWNLIQKHSVLLNTTIDRANIEFNKGKWNVRAGRQRINWGINMAWNPNDLFNAYNFVDFDYQERPGTDALRIQYFNKPMSQIEVAIKPAGHIDRSIMAARYLFNKKGYDFQFIAGHYLNDIAAGFGWAGNIKKVGFKGEASYFHPKDNFTDTSGVLVSSISFDYTFDRGIYINFSGFYNSNGSKSGNFTQALSSYSTLSAKNLLPTQFAAFANIGGAFTPIFSGGMSVMYLPDIQGLFLIPTLAYSIKENWDLDLVSQLLFAEYPTTFTNVSNAIFIRLRWSF